MTCRTGEHLSSQPSKVQAKMLLNLHYWFWNSDLSKKNINLLLNSKQNLIFYISQFKRQVLIQQMNFLLSQQLFVNCRQSARSHKFLLLTKFGQKGSRRGSDSDFRVQDLNLE